MNMLKPQIQGANIAGNALSRLSALGGMSRMQNALTGNQTQGGQPMNALTGITGDYDWTPYAVGGAAARGDSFTGLDPAFADGVYRMVTDAHAAGIPLQITSAYRSPEIQAQLYEAAIQKYGSPDAARKWVAPPGRSQHNAGRAADFALNGSLLRDANDPAAQWIAQNAGRYGLAVPMSWEPWQVEPVGARG